MEARGRCHVSIITPDPRSSMRLRTYTRRVTGQRSDLCARNVFLRFQHTFPRTQCVIQQHCNAPACALHSSFTSSFSSPSSSRFSSWRSFSSTSSLTWPWFSSVVEFYFVIKVKSIPVWKTKAKTQKMVLKISIYLLARRKQQKHDNLLGTSVARTRWFNVPLQSPLPKNYAIRTRDSAYWEQPPPQRARASASGSRMNPVA